jgi:hypothetical protein
MHSGTHSWGPLSARIRVCVWSGQRQPVRPGATRATVLWSPLPAHDSQSGCRRCYQLRWGTGEPACHHFPTQWWWCLCRLWFSPPLTSPPPHTHRLGTHSASFPLWYCRRLEALQGYLDHPDGAWAHPEPSHFVPLLVATAASAAQDAPAVQLFRGHQHSLAMDSYRL